MYKVALALAVPALGEPDGSVAWPTIQAFPKPQPACQCVEFEPWGTLVKCREVSRELVEIKVECVWAMTTRCSGWWQWELMTEKEYLYLETEQCQEYLCFLCLEPFGCVWCPVPIGEPMCKEVVRSRVTQVCGCYSRDPIPVLRPIIRR
jgi:hypothetical protein